MVDTTGWTGSNFRFLALELGPTMDGGDGVERRFRFSVWRDDKGYWNMPRNMVIFEYIDFSSELPPFLFL